MLLLLRLPTTRVKKYLKKKKKKKRMASSSQFQGQGHDSSTVPTEHAESMVNRGHIDIAPHATDHKPTQSSKVVRDSKGWDGKLRVDKKALKLMQHQGGGGGGGAHNGMENTEEMDAEAKSDSGTDDDDDDDSEESKTEVVRGHDSSVAAVPAEAGLAAGDRRVEIKDGEEIEADEGSSVSSSHPPFFLLFF